jgi:hypothetical protein
VVCEQPYPIDMEEDLYSALKVVARPASPPLTVSSSVSSPNTEHLRHEPVVLRFTADDVVSMAAD